jgi:hypothetical protein
MAWGTGVAAATVALKRGARRGKREGRGLVQWHPHRGRGGGRRQARGEEGRGGGPTPARRAHGGSGRRSVRCCRLNQSQGRCAGRLMGGPMASVKGGGGFIPIQTMFK